jgi:hypothetical protein
MITKLRLSLARWILGKHCACYNMGYHKLCDFQNQQIGNKQKRKT